MNTHGVTGTCMKPANLLLLHVAGLVAAATLSLGAATVDPPVQWQNLSSRKGDLPTPPGGSTQQTGAVVGDFDGDGVNDFILSFRQKPPSLVWYRRTTTGWDQYVIEKDYLTIEAGGAVYDIDGDGDLDLLNKPYTWDTPRVDVWLNNGTRAGARGVGTSRSFSGPMGLQLYSLRYLESPAW